MLPKSLRVWLCLFSLSFAMAQTIPEIAAQSAARISSLLPPRATVSFDFQNLSTLSVAESSAFRNALEAEAKKIRIETAGTTPPDSLVRVAISQNVHGYMIAGEVRSSEGRQIFFLPWTPARSDGSSTRLRLERKPVWEQPEPILDFALLNAGSGLVVLGAGKLSLYEMADGRWNLSGSVPLLLSRPVPRDPRGRLIADQTIFHVYLPGTTCTGSAQPPLGASCLPGNETWGDLRWVSDRNYLEMSRTPASVYSAGLPYFVSLDGRVRDLRNESVSGTAGWGSDLAGLPSVCGALLVVVATKAGDSDALDSMQAFEIANGAAEPISEALPLPGPVAALWPSEARDQVNMVVRNNGTGNYEASRLRLACAE